MLGVPDMSDRGFRLWQSSDELMDIIESDEVETDEEEEDELDAD